MKYNVTKHHLKTKEKLIAAFTNLKDARILIEKKITNDEINNIKTSYRIYDDLELVQEFNNAPHAFAEPEDPEAYSYAQFSFGVQVQPMNSIERTTVAYFNYTEDAHLFITGKFSTNDEKGALDTYLIFKGNILIATINKNTIENKAIRDLASTRTGKGSTSGSLSQSPVPRPTPAGGPSNYWAENDEE